ncbi:MAG: hypothetical protein R3338_08680, partial [Thermoanaerobaculia bacterium]|nr:hypothetical protein [Thermoanaerobaculia bacterium]
MTTRCVVCADEIEDGILCSKCDGPLRPGSSPTSDDVETQRSATGPGRLPNADPGLLISEVSRVLEASGAAAIIFDSSGRMISMSHDAREILRYGPAEHPGTLELETRLGIKVTRVEQSTTSTTQIGGIEFTLAVVLLAEGMAGRVVVLKSQAESAEEVELAFLHETVIGPLKSLNSTLRIAARQRGSDHLLNDAVSTIDQALSSLELSPEFSGGTRKEPAFVILDTLKARFGPTADSKGIMLQVDRPDPDLEVEDVRGVSNAISIYIENSLRYVPRGGQIVLGVRPVEHKGRPVLLFFVIDNGPVIAQEKREALFTPDYRPAPNATERTATRFAEVRGYAMSRGGK